MAQPAGKDRHSEAKPSMVRWGAAAAAAFEAHLVRRAALVADEHPDLRRASQPHKLLHEVGGRQQPVALAELVDLALDEDLLEHLPPAGLLVRRGRAGAAAHRCGEVCRRAGGPSRCA